MESKKMVYDDEWARNMFELNPDINLITCFDNGEIVLYKDSFITNSANAVHNFLRSEVMQWKPKQGEECFIVTINDSRLAVRTCYMPNTFCSVSSSSAIE